MNEQVYSFQHQDIGIAVIRVLEDEVVSVNEFLDEYELAYTCCYVSYRGKHILVDGGFDPDTVPGALEALEVQPEDIEFVLLTHTDFDHVAGLLMPDGSFTYPRARHVLGRQAWEHLNRPETLKTLSGDRATFYRRFIRSLEKRILLCDDACEPADGIRYILSPGHRVGHGAYAFEAETTPLIHTGDSYLHPLFAEHPDWPNTVDSDPVAAVDSRKALSAQAAKSGALILGSHLPFPGLGYLQHVGDLQYQWTPVDDQD